MKIDGGRSWVSGDFQGPLTALLTTFQRPAEAARSALPSETATAATKIPLIRILLVKLNISGAGQRKGEEDDEDVSMDAGEELEVCFYAYS